MDKFDVVIVGAGPAGSTAAYLLAKEGLQVVIIERSKTPGSKNVSGGLLFSRIVEEVFPQFQNAGVVERAIQSHGIMLLGKQASTTLEFQNYAESPRDSNAFSVLRARFDPWLAKQAEDAGAMLITGYTVDELLVRGGRVVGVRAGEDELYADVVVIAEGARSGLLRKAGLRSDFDVSDVSLGIKEIIQLPEQIINDRFQCDSGTGKAYSTVGSLGGVAGGGFIYTNRETISLGVVIKIASLHKSGKHPHQILDEFKSHSAIDQLISGGEVVEYSAQTVHSGGMQLISHLYGDGYVVVGSAARLILNNMMTMRGMDLAISSAASAARAIIDSHQTGDISVKSLASYQRYFQQSSVYQDLKTFSQTDQIFKSEHIYEVYPELVCNVLEDMFTVKKEPGNKVLSSLRKNMNAKVSWIDLMKDIYKIGRGLVV